MRRRRHAATDIGMRLVFFGTPEFAVLSLRALHAAGHQIAGVVTQPDRARGRHHSVAVPSPIKQFATDAGLPLAQPDRPRGEEFATWLRARNADLGVVVAYGHILLPELLAIPRLGMVNVHASLLPRWRGAAPIQWAIHAGDRESGVSIMQMEAGLDSGPVYLRRALPIGERENSASLAERLALLGAEALRDALPAIAARQTPEPQDESLVTYAPKLTRDVARIDWSRDADAVARHLRAFDPVPGAWTTLRGLELKLFRGGPPTQGTNDAAPGTPTRHGDELQIACGSGSLTVAEIQPAGRKRMSLRDWLNGGGLRGGEIFE